MTQQEYADMMEEQRQALYRAYRQMMDAGVSPSEQPSEPPAPQPTPKMKVVWKNGSEQEIELAGSMLLASEIQSLTDKGTIESISLNKDVIAVEQDAFLGLGSLIEVYLDGFETDEAAIKIAEMGIGIDVDGQTFLVVVYCSDGVVIVNDEAVGSEESWPHYNWANIVKLLEDYPTTHNNLPVVGSIAAINYSVDNDGTDIVETPWIIMGYNASIPEYVKYKKDDERVYVCSMKGGLLSAIAVGDTVYTKSGDQYTSTGKTVEEVGDELFTYGNNATFDVPMTIKIGGEEYTFAGYNVTLNSKAALGAKYNGNYALRPQFDSGRNTYGQNNWSTSMIRSYINGVELDNQGLSNQMWYDMSYNQQFTGSDIISFKNRFMHESTFSGAVIPAVNRTWVYSNWRNDGVRKLDNNDCEHVVDKFWLLGVGHLNANSSWYPDFNFDTSRFDQVFDSAETQSESWKKPFMKDSGKFSHGGFDWWLRSAASGFSSAAGYVYDGGGLGESYAGSYYHRGCAPACVIG